MKATPYIIVIFFIFFKLNSSIILQNNKFLLPDISEFNKTNNENTPSVSDNDTNSTFNFNIGQVDGTINIFGKWEATIGYATGFSLNPDFNYSFSIPDITTGVIFEQNRFITLNWITDQGINLYLFTSSDPELTEFRFQYDIKRIVHSLYIANFTEPIQIQPYRKIQSGKSEDILTGIKWGNDIYRGEAHIKFDSTSVVNDSFKGTNIKYNTSTLASHYLRGHYFYLPDTDISGTVTLLAGSDKNDYEYDINFDNNEDRYYKKLIENEDFFLSRTKGLITLKEGYYKKTLLISYHSTLHGSNYETGDTMIGKKGILNTTDISKVSHPNLFTKHENKNYLLLNSKTNYSPFEEKNSYRFTSDNSAIEMLNVNIYDRSHKRVTGFKTDYDPLTGSVRITKSNIKGAIDNIYPFYDTHGSEFYTSFTTRSDYESKNYIEISCIIINKALTLSQEAIENTITINLNGLPLDKSNFQYNKNDNTITIDKELLSSDNISVTYLSSSDDNYSLKATVKNDFKINDFFRIGDSIWYQMPLKLWEDSYYFKRFNAELIYSQYLKSDFSHLFKEREVTLNIKLDNSISLFLPEITGQTIIEDFEYEETGKTLSLDENDWYPVSTPDDTFTELAGFNSTDIYGKLFFKNMHIDKQLSADYLSIYDENRNISAYTDNGTIGPYSSSDGFSYDNNMENLVKIKNSKSLIMDVELEPQNAVSIAIPITEMELNNNYFTNLTALIDSIDLSSEVRLFIDAGNISERFDTAESIPQEETSDEGLVYYDAKRGIHLLKGKNNGINSTNDFDKNGILSFDNPEQITKFIYIDEDNTQSNYLSIKNKHKAINNFKIANPDILKSAKSIRLTVFNPSTSSTVTGKLLFNQLRLVESSWQSDVQKSTPDDKISSVKEIFPAEDSYLINHIFSQKMETVDSNLHFQRYRERTLKVTIGKNESMKFYKHFSPAIRIDQFQNLYFFILLDEKINRTITLQLIDTYGFMIEKDIDFSKLSTNKWNEINIELQKIKNYSSSNKNITTIRFIIPENVSEDIKSFYLDEIYMDNIIPLVSDAVSFEFNYEDPEFSLSNNKVTFFKSPFLNFTSSFITKNFPVDELSPINNHTFKFNAGIGAEIFGIKHTFSTEQHFPVIDNEIFNIYDSLYFQLFRESEKMSPVFFKINYAAILTGYNKYQTIDRSFNIEHGLKTNYFTLTQLYSTQATQESLLIHNNKLSHEIRTGFNEFTFNFTQSLFTAGEGRMSDKITSFSNLPDIFQYDFPYLVLSSENKTSEAKMEFLTQPLEFLKYNFNCNYSMISNDMLYNIQENYLTTGFLHIFYILITYSDSSFTFSEISFNRSVKLKSESKSNNLYWDSHFIEGLNLFTEQYPLILLPPLSGLFTNFGEKEVFDNTIIFDEKVDNLNLKFTWKEFLDNLYFIPEDLSFNLRIKTVNLVEFTEDISISFSTGSINEFKLSNLRNFMFDYKFNQNFSFNKNDFSSVSNFEISQGLYIDNSFEISWSIIDSIEYTKTNTDDFLKNSLTNNATLYKNFFKESDNGEYSGIEVSFMVKFIIESLHFLHNVPETLYKPLSSYVEPSIGYRFNKYFLINNKIMLAYSSEYSNITENYINNFGIKIIINGILTF